MKTALTIGRYLIHQLHAHGVRHVFGIPGDYVLGFYDLLSKSPRRVINTCDEQGAWFRGRGLSGEIASGRQQRRAGDCDLPFPFAPRGGFA